MDRTLGIVQARLASTRLKAKVARKLGGKSLLEWVVRRVTDCQRIDRVVVATGDDPADDLVRDLVPSDVAVFAGSEQDVLGRFTGCLKAFPAQSVVRVCADNPFVDPVLIDRLVRTADEHPECDYISYGLRGGRPAILSAVGLFAEWCKADALLTAARSTRDPADREHVTRFLYSHPELFTVRLVPVPAELDRDDVRLTIDLEEDWETAQTIYEALGPERLDWQRIAKLLETHPGMRNRMAALNRANAKT